MSLPVLLLLAVLASSACGALTGTPRRLAADVSDAVVRATDLSQGGAQDCPAGCEAEYCAYVSTTGGYYCQKCLNNLLVRKSDGLCGCAAGKYSPDGTATCKDCPMGSWCSGGVYTETDYPRAVRCPSNMTTRGMRSTNINACLNIPGYSYYNLNNLLLALQCPANTYSPGLRKQRACVPCPTGFSTLGKVGQSRADACVVPPGYFLKTPGQAAPCPMGEYKEGVGPDAACTKCAFMVTTQTSASTSNASCSYMLAGWYARNMSGTVITAVAPCPQGYYCPGGRVNHPFDPLNPTALLATEASIKRCPQGTWTTDLAATVASECLTPPGYKTLNGSTVPCEAGSYRAGWTPAELATSCTSCGSGVSAEKTDRIIQYDLVTGAMDYVPVTTAPDDCYILPGQGLYYETLAQTWRAKNCISNEYGAEKVMYGLSAFPCRPCPTNMVTSTNRTGFPNSASYFVSDAAAGAEGFTSPMACVNQAGFGYNGRISQPCDRGTWNLQDTYSTCRACDYGLTTAAVGSGKQQADCGLMAGFGFRAGTVGPCAAGTYNNATYTPGNTTACYPCPTGTTTQAEGADSVSQCNLCMGGWGETGCLTQCGGKGDAADYGVNGRAMDSPCAICSYGNTGFSFQWRMQNDIFVAQPVSPPGADSSWDCVSEFAQLSDSAWYIPTADNTAMNITGNVTSFVDCVALCKDDCEYVTYDYTARTCYVRIGYEPVYMGAPLIAFKAVPSGDVGTNAFSVQAASVRHRHGAPVDAAAASNAGSSEPAGSSSAGGSSNTGGEAAASSSSSSSEPSVSAQEAASGASVASGQYSFWIEPNAATVGYQSPAPGRDSFALGYAGLQQCLDECDLVSWCAGITMDLYVDIPTSPRSCKLIRGDTSPGRFLRTVTRADVNRLRVPSLFV